MEKLKITLIKVLIKLYTIYITLEGVDTTMKPFQHQETHYSCKMQDLETH